MRSIGVLVILLTLWLLSACGDKNTGPRGSGNAAPAVVTTQTVEPLPWLDAIEAVGTARARESVAITAKVSETVAKVGFDSGQYVRAGEVLVWLSGDAELAGLNEASADYREAQTLFERLQTLAAKQLVASSQLDTQRAARDAAKARMDRVRAQLADRAIAAPFDGLLGLRQISPGSLVTPGTVITTLDDVSRIQVDFSVPERQVSALALGQAAVATSDAYPNHEFTGAVISLDSRVDSATRSIAARAEFANPDRTLRPGMLMRLRIFRPGRTVLAVPEIAVVQIGEQSFVFRVRADGTVEQALLRLGERQNGRVEVLDGLKAGERIVVDGTVKLRPGGRIVEAPAGTGADSPQRAAQARR